MARKPRTPSVNPLAKFKSAAAQEVAKILESEQLTQTEAAYILKDAPSQISLVTCGKTRGFSEARLIRMLAGLGRDIEITVKPARGKKGRVTHRFLAA